MFRVLVLLMTVLACSGTVVGADDKAPTKKKVKTYTMRVTVKGMT